jgi:hypothetical protein
MGGVKSRRYIPYISIFLIYLFMEGLCYLGLFFLEKKFNTPYDPNVSVLSEEQRTSLEKFLKHRKGEHTAQDAVLGWVTNYSHPNTAGMRDDREYKSVPPLGVIWITAFGDSFTYGSDVALGDTWEKRLTVIDPSIEVLNLWCGSIWPRPGVLAIPQDRNRI